MYKIISIIQTPLKTEVYITKESLTHIIKGHPELSSDIPLVIEETLSNPDTIREGNVENSKTYFKTNQNSGKITKTQTGILVVTKMICGKEMVTTCYKSKDKKAYKLLYVKEDKDE